MIVKVIGSGSIWCKYNSASYLVDNKFFIDFPNGMCKNLYRQGLNPQKFDYVFLTHFHGDHYFDLPFYFLLKSKFENKNVTIFCDKQGKRKILKILKLAFPNSAKKIYNALNINFNFSNVITVDNYNIKRVLVSHGKMTNACGYIVKDNANKTVGFTGDTALCDNVELMASSCSYLFCDCMFTTGNNKHMGIDNIKYLAEKYNDCTFIISHLNDATRDIAKNLNYKNIIVPDDGSSFTI